MAIGWALLGPGRHAARNVIAQLKNAAGTRLVAVVSRDRARGEDFARRYGIERAYLSLQDALRNPEVDAVYDATPDGLHARNAIEAARAGKHVLVEKPLAISLREGVQAIDACRRHGVQLGVVFNQRHEAVHQEARRLVREGEIGDVVLARVQIVLRPPRDMPAPSGGNWRSDPAMRRGGILMSIGDHAYDTLAYLVGQDIEEVCAFTDAKRADAPDERAASMLLKLSRGAIGHAAANSRAPFSRRAFEIHGTKGSLILENTYAYLSGSGEDPRPSLELVNEQGRSVRHFAASECFRLEVERFNRSIEGRDSPMTPPREALRALAVTEALYESIRGARAVKVLHHAASLASAEEEPMGDTETTAQLVKAIGLKAE
jgi:1,5-anhydro-D-fructose reductase (1,5-anhydro-D-mannitol-forming)